MSPVAAITLRRVLKGVTSLSGFVRQPGDKPRGPIVRELHSPCDENRRQHSQRHDDIDNGQRGRSAFSDTGSGSGTGSRTIQYRGPIAHGSHASMFDLRIGDRPVRREMTTSFSKLRDAFGWLGDTLELFDQSELALLTAESLRDAEAEAGTPKR